jgi:mannosyltransferase
MSAGTKIRNRAVLCGLGVIVALAIWLRLHGIADKSFWTDEGVSAAFTKLDWYDLGRILWRREANMTLYYLLLRAWTHLGDSVAMIRGFSALWSVGTVGAIFVLGRRMYGSVTALIAALLLAVNAYSVRYAQEARSYALVACLVTLSTLFLVSAIDESDERKRRREWTWYMVASVLGVYSHFFALLVVVAHGVGVWRALPYVKDEFVSAAKKIGLCALPAMLFIVTTGVGPIGWIPRPSPTYVAIVFRHFAGNGGWTLAALYLACVVLFAWRRERDWKAWLLMSWWAVPWGLALAASVLRPVFLARYMIISLPALVLMAAAGITSLRRCWAAAPVLGVICWFAIGGVRSYYARDFDISREDLRGATQYVMSNAQTGDVIAFHKGQSRFAFSYYASHINGVRPRIVCPGGDQPTWRDFVGSATPQVLECLSKENARVWLVMSETLGPEGEDAAAEEMKYTLANGHQLSEVKDLQDLKIYRYSAR